MSPIIIDERVFQLLFSTGDIIANIWLSQNFTLTDDYSSFTIRYGHLAKSSEYFDYKNCFSNSVVESVNHNHLTVEQAFSQLFRCI